MNKYLYVDKPTGTAAAEIGDVKVEAAG